MRCRSCSHTRFILCFLVALFSFSTSAWAEGRVALVVGNSAYRNVPMLPNPTADAGDVAHALERLGFAVTTVKDAGFDDLRHALIAFGAQAREADMAVIYYAGHGMEVAGENWLVPVDAALQSDTDIENEAIGLKSLLLAVSSARTLGLIVLDACRNNPFDSRMQHASRTRAVSRGLAPIEPVDNVLVAYAAKDGTTATDGAGSHSPFTAALLDHLEMPGLEINFLFRNVRDDVLSATGGRQQPFFYGSLSKEAVYLKPAAAGSTTAPAAATPAADEIAWSFIADATDAAILHRFTRQFPASPHRADAERRIATIEAAPAPVSPLAAPAPATEDQAVQPGQQRVAQAFQSDGPQIEAAWSVVKTSADPAILRRFTDEFPNRQRKTIVKALGGGPGTGGVLRQLRGDQMRAVLSDYGSFVSHPRYGDVWVPSVTPVGWHPYEPCHWVKTQRLGWYYLDRTPWGAIVHHFGRWTHDPQMGWIWVPGVDFSPGWVVWRTSPQKIGWAPMPPVEDMKVVSPATFNTADFWTFMDTATFARGCDGKTIVAPPAARALLQTTTYVRDVKAVDGITIVVLPSTLAGDLVPIDIAYDPWPPWLFGSVLGDWNWMWNAPGMVEAALCPVVPALKPADHPIAPPVPLPERKAKAPPLPKPEPKTVQRRRRNPPADDGPPTRRRPVVVEVPVEQTDDPPYRPVPRPYFSFRPGPIFRLPLGGLGLGGYGGGESRPTAPSRGPPYGDGLR